MSKHAVKPLPGVNHVINYLRRSRQDEEREKRTGEDTLSEQRTLMDRVLSQWDITYEQRFEIGSGDKIETRPVFMQIIEELKAGKFDAVAVKEISRLGRGSYTDMGVIYDLIMENGIYIITPYKLYDPRNTADLRQIRFELFISREEFETTRERMTGAKHTYAMSGKWMAAKVPYGYEFNPTTQRLQPKEDESAVIQLIFDLYVNGLNGRPLGYRAIGTHLQRMGILTPNGKSFWFPSSVQRVLNNRAYIGQVSFRKRQRKDGKIVMRSQDEWIVVDGAHEPIVDRELFEKAQQMMQPTNRQKPSVKVDFSPCELAGIVTCGHCGLTMQRQYKIHHYKKLDGEISTYHKEFLCCPSIPSDLTVQYRDVERDILTALETIAELDNDILQEYIRSVTPTNSPSVNVEQVRERLEQRKKELQRRRQFVFDKHFEGVYSDDDFVTHTTALDKELADIDKSLLFSVDEMSAQPEINTVDIKRRLKSVLDVYHSLQDRTEKNVLLRHLVGQSTIYLVERGKGKRKTKYEIAVDINPAYFDFDLNV